MLPKKFWRYHYLEHLCQKHTFGFSIPLNMPTSPDLVNEEWYFQVKLAHTPWTPFLWNHFHWCVQPKGVLSWNKQILWNCFYSFKLELKIYYNFYFLNLTNGKPQIKQGCLQTEPITKIASYKNKYMPTVSSSALSSLASLIWLPNWLPHSSHLR